jgi:hypothetical protein
MAGRNKVTQQGLAKTPERRDAGGRLLRGVIWLSRSARGYDSGDAVRLGEALRGFPPLIHQATKPAVETNPQVHAHWMQSLPNASCGKLFSPLDPSICC